MITHLKHLAILTMVSSLVPASLQAAEVNNRKAVDIVINYSLDTNPNMLDYMLRHTPKVMIDYFERHPERAENLAERYPGLVNRGSKKAANEIKQASVEPLPKTVLKPVIIPLKHSQIMTATPEKPPVTINEEANVALPQTETIVTAEDQPDHTLTNDTAKTDSEVKENVTNQEIATTSPLPSDKVEQPVTETATNETTTSEKDTNISEQNSSTGETQNKAETTSPIPHEKVEQPIAEATTNKAATSDKDTNISETNTKTETGAPLADAKIEQPIAEAIKTEKPVTEEQESKKAELETKKEPLLKKLFQSKKKRVPIPVLREDALYDDFSRIDNKPKKKKNWGKSASKS